jgi:hypothetical protein
VDSGHGNLGLGDIGNNTVLTPTKIPNLTAQQIIIAECETDDLDHLRIFAIDLKNNVRAFGANEKGQLGIGDEIDRSTPTKISKFKAKSIVATEWYTVAISDNDYDEIPEVFRIGLTLGKNELISYCKNDKSKKIVCDNNLFWKEKFFINFINPDYDWKALYDNYHGDLYAFGQLSSTNIRRIPKKLLNSDLKIKMIAAGGFQTVMVDLNDSAWLFGENEFGQLGVVGTTETHIRSSFSWYSQIHYTRWLSHNNNKTRITGDFAKFWEE